MNDYNFMEGPQGDISKRKFSKEIQREQDEEAEAERLAEFGIDCYECGDRHMPTDMHPKADEEGYTQLVCKYCI